MTTDKLEVGNYVNEFSVKEITNNGIYHYSKKGLYLTNKIEIKTIMTKEQAEEVEYRL